MNCEETDMLFERIEIEIEILKENIMERIKCQTQKCIHDAKVETRITAIFISHAGKVTDTDSFE